MNAKELWNLAERKVVIRARAGLYDHIELGSRSATEIWAMTQTFVPHCSWFTVLRYQQPAYLNSNGDHCGISVVSWLGLDNAESQIEAILSEWPEYWKEPIPVIYDSTRGKDNLPEVLNPLLSIGLLRHLTRIEEWCTLRSAYPEGKGVWDTWNADVEAKHIHTLGDRITGYIGDQLRSWQSFGKSMSGFIAGESALPDICV